MHAVAPRGERIALLLLLGSGGLLAGALFFQYVLDIRPCPLCHWQRYPHIVALLLAGAALVVRQRRFSGALLLLAGLALLVTIGLAAFHVGVEQKWWAGAAACEGNLEAGPMTAEEMLKGLTGKRPPRCDEIAWSLFGVSMAGWNLVFSLVLAGVAFAGAVRLFRVTR
jgi:disulfide bond formation protein DsbB